MEEVIFNWIHYGFKLYVCNYVSFVQISYVLSMKIKQ